MTISVSTHFCSSAMPDFGDAHATLTFEVERLGDDADGENAHLARDLRDHRRGARAGAAAHAGGDEAHMRAGEMLANFFARFFRGGAADFGLRAGAEAFGDLQAHLDDALGLRRGERLRVGVGDEEIDAGQAGGDHVVDGVAAAAADAANHDAGLQFPQFGSLKIDRHLPGLSPFHSHLAPVVLRPWTPGRRTRRPR